VVDAKGTRWAREVLGGEITPPGVDLALIQTQLRDIGAAGHWHDEGGMQHGRRPGLIQQELRAVGVWERAGGSTGEELRVLRRRAVRDERRAAEARRQFSEYFQQGATGWRGLSGFKRRATMGPRVDIEIEPRSKRRRRRRRGKRQPDAAAGIAAPAAAGRHKRRKARETAAWSRGTWEAGDDWAVQTLLDRRPADEQDVVNYAATEGAEVSIGSDMFLVAWEGWGDEYNSWEPRSFIIDEELIDAFETNVAGHGAETRTHPDEVFEVRYTRHHSRGKPRLEAHGRWFEPEPEGGGERCHSQWIRVTRRHMSSAVFGAAKLLEEQTLRSGGETTARVDARRLTRAAAALRRPRDTAEFDDDDCPRPPRRRRALRTIEEGNEAS
jgi:hypothetical protein